MRGRFVQHLDPKVCANALVAPLHDRMPVILAGDEYDAWLDPDSQNTARLLEMLRPDTPESWTLRQVSRRVNRPRNDGPELLAAVHEQ